MDPNHVSNFLKTEGAASGGRSVLAPFESPIEEELHRIILKHLAPDAVVSNQIEFNTPNGNYRVDFLLALGDRKIVLEANGKEFHDDLTDIYRGAFILGFSDVRSVYYIRGCDITHSLPTVLYAISRYEPYLFSDRGLKSLEALTDIKAERGGTEYCEAFCSETGIRMDSSESLDPPIAYRLTLLRKKGDHDKWERIYKAALENPGVSAKDFDAVFIKSPHNHVRRG
jgi:hypothetical protein